MERLSRNTAENAEFSKDLVKPKDGERWLLVTSAFHMPRSVGLFRKPASLWSLIRWIGGSAGAKICWRLPMSRATGSVEPIPRCGNGWGSPRTGYGQDRRVASGAAPRDSKTDHWRARNGARAHRRRELTPCNSKRRRKPSISPAWWPT